MSGLYLLLVVGIWAGLTALFARGWRRWRASEDANKRTVDVVCLLVMLLWVGASFWYGGGRKIYYDTLVNRMCREDGGVKVYETVKLPAERFDKYGNVHIPDKKDAKPEDEYYYVSETKFLREDSPKVIRMRTQIIRRNDAKVLGESVRYGRGGGDLPGPWHPSSFTCPSPTEKPYLEPSVFHKGEF